MSSALSTLVSFLTRPLILVYPSETVSTVRLILEANLSPLFTTSVPFTFVFSASATPPAPFFTACLLSGVSWSEWTKVFEVQDLHFFVSKESITVAINPSGTPSLSIWAQDIDESTAVPCISKQRLSSRLLDTTRSIKIPSLPACLDPVIEIDSDSDSDSESNASFTFSSSTESLTSMSSVSSSPVMKSSRPLLSSTPPPAPPRYLSRSQRRLTHVAVDDAKKDVTKYMYKGGSTGVMTGGVMLGASVPAPTRRKKSLLLGPDSGNWRRV
ncbi:hypothetical protein C8J56DRAFT_927616 [Mycena floridula]|nr:hypothetical protein C8J56DRAFT_927616 [Mycena floridula]